VHEVRELSNQTQKPITLLGGCAKSNWIQTKQKEKWQWITYQDPNLK